MKVRRKILNEIKGQPRVQKALAFALLIKSRTRRDSTVKDFSINKLRTLTGLSAVTVAKYLYTLEEQGWVRYDGKRGQHLVICKLSSHSEGRNVCVDNLCYDSFKDVYNSIRTLLAMSIQARKDFIQRTIQIATNPKRGQNFKAARRTVKRLVNKGIIRDIYTKYKEYGLSYQRIAKELGSCARTAFGVIEYGIQKGFVIRHKHQEQFYAKGVFFLPVRNYTFTTKNNMYRILANTYTSNMHW